MFRPTRSVLFAFSTNRKRLRIEVPKPPRDFPSEQAKKEDVNQLLRSRLIELIPLEKREQNERPDTKIKSIEVKVKEREKRERSERKRELQEVEMMKGERME